MHLDWYAAVMETNHREGILETNHPRAKEWIEHIGHEHQQQPQVSQLNLFMQLYLCMCYSTKRKRLLLLYVPAFSASGQIEHLFPVSNDSIHGQPFM